MTNCNVESADSIDPFRIFHPNNLTSLNLSSTATMVVVLAIVFVNTFLKVPNGLTLVFGLMTKVWGNES
jgi:hypothetical protein